MDGMHFSVVCGNVMCPWSLYVYVCVWLCIYRPFYFTLLNSFVQKSPHEPRHAPVSLRRSAAEISEKLSLFAAECAALLPEFASVPHRAPAAGAVAGGGAGAGAAKVDPAAAVTPPPATEAGADSSDRFDWEQDSVSEDEEMKSKQQQQSRFSSEGTQVCFWCDPCLLCAAFPLSVC